MQCSSESKQAIFVSELLRFVLGYGLGMCRSFSKWIYAYSM